MRIMRRLTLAFLITAVLVMAFFADAAYRLSLPASAPATTPSQDTAYCQQLAQQNAQFDLLVFDAAIKLNAFEQSLRTKPASAEIIGVLAATQFLQYLGQVFSRGATMERKEGFGYFYIFLHVPPAEQDYYGTDTIRLPETGAYPANTRVNVFRGNGWGASTQVFTPEAGRRLDKITYRSNYRAEQERKILRGDRRENEKALAEQDTPNYFALPVDCADAIKGRFVDTEFKLWMIGKGDQTIDDTVSFLALPEDYWKAQCQAPKRMSEAINHRSASPPKPPALDSKGKSIPAETPWVIVVKEEAPAQPLVTLDGQFGSVFRSVMDHEPIRGEAKPIDFTSNHLYVSVQPELAPYVYFSAAAPFVWDASHRYGYFDLTNVSKGVPFAVTVKANGVPMKGGR